MNKTTNTTPAVPSGHYRATVEVLWGNRRMSDLLAAADLGLTGAGVKDLITINYKEGIVPGVARVSRAMDDMILESDATQTGLKVHTYKVLSIDFIPSYTP